MKWVLLIGYLFSGPLIFFPSLVNYGISILHSDFRELILLWMCRLSPHVVRSFLHLIAHTVVGALARLLDLLD
jgi:hypothetical protein